MRLMTLGLERLSNLIMEMADLSESTVEKALEAYTNSTDVRDEIFSKSETLRTLQDEVNDLATELIARYQPVASDLRFITSCMEISYGFERFGRYAYDISDVLVIYSDLSGCDKASVVATGGLAKEMIRTSIRALRERNVVLAKELKSMDDRVDSAYRGYLRQLNGGTAVNDIRCIVSATLVLRYLERISDHATYIGDAVIYISTGERVPRVPRLESQIEGR